MKRILIPFACLFILLEQARAGEVEAKEHSGLKVLKSATANGFASDATTVAGGNGAGASVNQLSQPIGIFVDGGGNLYVTDQRNHRVQKWAPELLQPI